MNPDELRRWAERQTRALIAAGVHPFDAEQDVAWVVANVPPYTDPDQWIPTSEQLTQPDLSFAEVIQDARAAFFAGETVPRQFKRLLEAKMDR